ELVRDVGADLGGGASALLEIGGERGYGARQLANLVAAPEQALVGQGLIRVLVSRLGQPFEWPHQATAEDDRQKYREGKLVDRHLDELSAKFEQAPNPPSRGFGQIDDAAGGSGSRQRVDRLPSGRYMLGEHRFSSQRSQHLIALTDCPEATVDF